MPCRNRTSEPSRARGAGIKERAVELLGDHPDYPLLRSILRIGPVNTLAVLVETGDLRRFRHHRQFLEFCGMELAQPGSWVVPKFGDRNGSECAAAHVAILRWGQPVDKGRPVYLVGAIRHRPMAGTGEGDDTNFRG